LNYLARFGWSHGDQEIFSIDSLVNAFSWDSVNKADGKFDAKKFLAIDHEHLKEPRLTPDDEYVERVMPFLEKRGLSADRQSVRACLPMIRERATTFVDAADRLDFVFRDPPQIDEAAAKKFFVPDNAPRLRELADVISGVESWTAPALEAAMNAWLASKGLHIKDVAQAARVALTGRTASPGLFDVIAALGKERALARLRDAANASEKR
jgi:glutamyl-tRNA synthetase